jgi:hypothetical protein
MKPLTISENDYYQGLFALEPNSSVLYLICNNECHYLEKNRLLTSFFANSPHVIVREVCIETDGYFEDVSCYVIPTIALIKKIDLGELKKGKVKWV